MKRQVRIPTAMVVGLVMALSAAAWAGTKSITTVTITVTGATGSAGGNMGAVRNTSDNVQFIGCSVNTTYDATTSVHSSSVFCVARNAAGVSASCMSEHPDFIAAAQAISSDSNIYFTWDAAGDCTLLTVAAFSYYAPKAP